MTTDPQTEHGDLRRPLGRQDLTGGSYIISTAALDEDGNTVLHVGPPPGTSSAPHQRVTINPGERDTLINVLTHHEEEHPGGYDERFPALTRHSACMRQAAVIGEFLDWLVSKGIHLARYGDDDRHGMHDPRLWPISDSFNQLLASYFDVDLDAVERERTELLQMLRGDGRGLDAPPPDRTVQETCRVCGMVRTSTYRSGSNEPSSVHYGYPPKPAAAKCRKAGQHDYTDTIEEATGAGA